MDPISLLLGFSRALVPPMAPPVTQIDAPRHATTNLGLDRDLIKAIFADSRVQAAQTKQEAATPPPPDAGMEPGAAEAAEGANQATQAEPNKLAQRAQRVQEAAHLEAGSGVDDLDRAQAIDPMMVAQMKAIYADRLTLGGTLYERRLQAMLETQAGLPWESPRRG